MLKHKFEISLPYNINIIIDKLTAYYDDNPNYSLTKNSGFFIIEKRIKQITSPFSRIGNKIQFKIESIDQSTSKIYGFVKPGTESQGFLISLLLSLLIVLSIIITDFTNSGINFDKIYNSTKWFVVIILLIAGIISVPKRFVKNIEQEFNLILKSKKSINKKYSVKNYCTNCNSLETNYETGICSKCGRQLTTIV